MQTWMTEPLLTLSGDPVTLQAYAGSVLLIVNVASECGYTAQYEGLQALYARYKDRGFAVLGFPCNDFGLQEPGDPVAIKAFCTSRFGVTFPMFEKVSIVGPKQHPLYRALTAARPKAMHDGPGLRDGLATFAASKGLPAPTTPPDVLWNFEKFLVGRDGAVVERFGTDIQPYDGRLSEAIEEALAV